MTHLDLFSGIGGFTVAASWCGFETVAFSETNDYCKARLAEHWPGIPNVGDIRNAIGIGADLVTGGFPCQPFSRAGKRRGKADDRWLWPEMRDVIAASGAAWVVAENVPGIIGMELDAVLSDLEDIGYTCGTLEIPACAVGAPHPRERVWIVANIGLREPVELSGSQQTCGNGVGDSGENVPNSDKPGLQDGGQPGEPKVQTQTVREVAQPKPERCGCSEQPTESRLGGGVHGVPRRLDPGWGSDEWERGIPRTTRGGANRTKRIRALGNAIVPQVAYEILKRIPEAEKQA